MEDFLKNRIIFLFHLPSSFFENEQNNFFFKSIYEEVCKGLSFYNFDDYIEVFELNDFLYNIFCLIRGIKNKKSLEMMTKYLECIPNTRAKALKIRELIIQTINSLN